MHNIPVHRATAYESPEDRQKRLVHEGQIAEMFLIYGDTIEGLEIPLFGEGSGAMDALNSHDRINRDAQKISERLHIKHEEAVDFIKRICMAKSLTRTITMNKKHSSCVRTIFK